MEDDVPYRNLLAAMKDQAADDKKFLERSHVAMEELNLYNSLYAEFILELTEDLSHFALESGKEPGDEMEIDEEYGKGINLHHIIRTLNAYDKTDNEDYLNGVLVLIMREKERRALWDEA